MNLLLHLLTLLERVQQGKHISDSTEGVDYSNGDNAKRYINLINDLCANLEEVFGIQFSKGDHAEIEYFILTTASQANLESIGDTVHAAGEKLFLNIQQITEEIYDMYKINLVNNFFLAHFSIHVKGLIERATHKRFNRNPLLENIKLECKMIFDIAISLALKIEKLYHFKISEDEIAYIAMHVASEIERQKVNEEKIQALLFCPSYNDYANQLKDQLTMILGNDVYIKAIVSEIGQLQEYTYDLILSTVELPLQEQRNVIRIPPFLRNDKKSLIIHHLSLFQQEQRKKILIDNFNKYFSPELFYYNNDFKNKEALIKTVCAQMHQMGVVQEDFEDSVLEREYAASTAFSNIAIPHSIRMDAVKTSIAIIISAKGIPWNHNHVHAVLLFAVNYVDRNNFSYIYESLIDIFEQPQIVNDICAVKNLEELRYVIDSGISNYSD